MADEDINPVVLLADPKVNHRVWAACLKWSPVVKKRKRLVRTVLIFTESSDQLSRATDRVPGLPASPGYVQ